MRLLLKVVKSSLVFRDGDTVHINNTIHIPPAPDPDPENMDEAQLLAKQKADEAKKVEEKIASEVQRRSDALRTQIDVDNRQMLQNIETSKISIIKNATKEAAAIVAKAHEDALLIKEKAQKSGKEEGFVSGKLEALKQCDKYVQTAAQFLAGINSKKDAYFISMEDEILDTVIEMVKKITLLELKTDSDAIFRILKQASRAFRNDDYLKISFANGDVSQDIITDIDFIKSVVGNIKDIDVEILPDAETGTVILDNGSEIIDASVPTQIDLLKEILNNSRK